MHAHGVLGGLDVAVAEHGNRQCVHDRRDLIPACGAGVHLRSRPRMQREHARACVLAPPRDRDGITHLLAPSAADLARHRQVRAAGNAANDVPNEIEIAQAARAAVSPNDLLDGAAEVDVDELRTENVSDERGRVSHRRGIGAEDLDTDRTLIAAKAQLVDGRRVLATNPFRREELGDDDVRAKSTAEASEGRFRHTSHGREVEWHLGVEGKGKAFHSFKLRSGRSPCNVSI